MPQIDAESGRRLRHAGPAAAAAVCILAALPVPAQDDEARDSDLVEHAESRLVQLDVTVTGPEDVVDELTRDDFKLKIADFKIHDFEVDRVCREGAAPGVLALPDEVEEPGKVAIPRPTLGPTTFLFYFDQIHLTMYGRQRSMDLAQSLIPQLITDGNSGMIVSNAEALETYAALTEDPDVLLDAVERLESDRDQWHLFAAMEERRIEEVIDEIRAGAINRAVTLAKLHHADELWRAERDYRRFAMVLGSLANVPPPKVVVYFADNMRINAGEHFVRLIAEPGTERGLDISQGVTMGAVTSFDRVVDEASSHGVRLYTVQAEGMTSTFSRRMRDAQGALTGLALETGGRAFLNGTRANRIADAILGDLSCLYLVSFRPDYLPRDVSLAVKLKVKRPGVKAQVRGRVVIQSESARLTSRLLAAYSSPGSAESADGGPVRSTLIPTGYLDGEFRALLQVAVPRSEVPVSTWDLGASIISRGKQHDASQRMTVSTPDIPVVLQHPISFEPGPFELVAVAHNVTADVIASEQIEGAWPRPEAELASFGPIAILQVTPAAISRRDRVMTRGLVALSDDETLKTGRATALVTIVCRSSDLKGTMTVERTLLGSDAVTFPAIDMERKGESCAVVRDLIPWRTMGAGEFNYRIRATQHGEELASTSRTFVVRADDRPGPSRGTPP